MKRNLLSLALCTIVALSVAAEPTMVASYKLGDSMGSGGVTAKVISLYDSTNKVIRTNTIATGSDSISFSENIKYYEYDENNRLVHDYSVQYLPAYDRWQESTYSYYQYDEAGRLARIDIDNNRAYIYTYDDNGNMTNEQYITTLTSSEASPILQDITYSDFDANHNPARAESNGYQSDYRFDATMSYDEMGRCVDILRKCIQGTYHSRETNSYDSNGVIVDKYTYMSAFGKGGRESGTPGAAKDSLRYEYHHSRTALGNGWYHYLTYSWFNPQWTRPSVSYKELYVTLDGAYAPRNIVAENISTDEQPQTVKVTCDVPATLPCENTSYLVWRGGDIVGTVEAADGKIEFVETGVPSGVFDYIVQAYDATNDVYYNCSDVAQVDATIKLNPATNIRVVGGYWGTYEDAQTPAHDSFFVKLAWDVEESAHQILGYKVWLYPWAYALYEIDGDTRTCEIPMTDEEVGNFRIDVIYEYGVEEGEYAPLFWDNAADFEGEPIVKHYLTHIQKYGDHMGGSGASGIVYLIYDINNNLSRKVEYGYNTDGTTSPIYNYFYEYNNAGELISQYYRQYSSLGTWGKHRETYTYEYADGKMIAKEDTTLFVLYEYTYNEDGYLVETVEKRRSSGQTTYDTVYSTLTYSNFDENGNPANSSYIHALYASSSYTTTYTYDEKGRLLVAESLTLEGKAYQKYEYEYDEYDVELCKTFSTAKYDEQTFQPTEEFVYASRSVRQPLGNAAYKCYDENYNAKNDSWKAANNRFTIENYSPLNGKLAPLNLTAKDASTADSPNTISVECNFPKTRLAGAQYIVWRGWIPVDTVAAPDAQGKILFEDVNVENGTYEYIIQTYDTATGKSFNATPPFKMTLAAVLSPVENIRYTGQTEGTYRDADVGKLPVYWVHFEWDVPNTTLPIVNYEVYQENYKIPSSVTINTNDSVWVYRYDEDEIASQQRNTSVSIVVVYELGKSESTSQTFEIALSALENVTMEGTAYVADKTLFTEPNAQVTLYNLSGAVIATYNNRANIDLSHLPTGMYVAIVKVGDAGQLLKVVL